MRNFQEKNSIHKRILKSVPFLIVLLIIIIFILINAYELFEKMQETDKDKKLSIEKLDLLENRKNVLEEDINELKTEEGIERIYRENYGLGKEGEELIIILEDKIEIIEKEEVKKDRFFKKILNFFF